MPKSASRIYSINPKGFVTEIFSENAVFFKMLNQNGNILLGTGNNAQLFSINPQTEEKSIAYEDETASQITAIAAEDGDVLMGTANPAKLIRLSKNFASEGTYISDLVDAAQPVARAST